VALNFFAVTDPSTGEQRGFGFVEFASVEIAASAQKAMHGSDVGEPTPIRVSFANPSNERRNRSRNLSGSRTPGAADGREGGRQADSAAWR
jgi:cleavage stimulation factor subunit 2